MIKIANNLLNLALRAKQAGGADDYDLDADTYSIGGSGGDSILGTQVGDFSQIGKQYKKNLGQQVQKSLIEAYSKINDLETGFNKDFAPWGVSAKVLPYLGNSPGYSSAEMLEKVKAISPKILNKIKGRAIKNYREMERLDTDYLVNIKALRAAGIDPEDMYDSQISVAGMSAINKALEKKYKKPIQELREDDELYQEVDPVNFLMNPKARKNLLKYMGKPGQKKPSKPADKPDSKLPSIKIVGTKVITPKQKDEDDSSIWSWLGLGAPVGAGLGAASGALFI